jgi:hypothetical protein
MDYETVRKKIKKSLKKKTFTARDTIEKRTSIKRVGKGMKEADQ